MKNALYISIIALILSSCEDIIDVDLNSVEPKLVVEGFINLDSKNAEVQLTQTTDYFNPGDYVKISGASVILTGNSGESNAFNESIRGTYSFNNLNLENSSTYNLTIVSDGREYSAEVSLPKKVEILATTIEATPEYLEFSGGYLVNCHLTDPAGIDNFYRYKVYAANEVEKVVEKFNVFDDEFVDGNDISMRWEEKQFFPGDTVVVELRSIDKASYDYFMTVNSLLENGFVVSASPANPSTNFSGDALGYFGAYTISLDTVIISSNKAHFFIQK